MPPEVTYSYSFIWDRDIEYRISYNTNHLNIIFTVILKIIFVILLLHNNYYS